eukprot:357925-Chlamydomonas_euryale.AAC.1
MHGTGGFACMGTLHACYLTCDTSVLPAVPSMLEIRSVSSVRATSSSVCSPMRPASLQKSEGTHLRGRMQQRS